MADSEKPHKKWGKESEYTRMLRERSLEEVIVTSCGLCGVSKKASAKEGMAWFARHQQTVRHQRALRKITRKGDRQKPKSKRG